MLKPTTKQLIESFRYRRLAYAPKVGGPLSHDRKNIAEVLRSDRCEVGRAIVRRTQLHALSYRQHLADSLHSIHEG